MSEYQYYEFQAVSSVLSPIRCGASLLFFDHCKRRDFSVKPELKKLARHRLARAKEAFAEGEHLLTKSVFMGFIKLPKEMLGLFPTASELAVLTEGDMIVLKTAAAAQAVSNSRTIAGEWTAA